MRSSKGPVAAPLLALALSLLAASPVSADDGGDGGVVGAEGSSAVRMVDSVQSEVEADPDSEPARRLVDRESSERVNAVVIALWAIAGVMTVLLGLFLWHTSPRRRLRLAVGGSAGLSDEAEGAAEPAGDEPGEDEPGADSSKGRFEAMARAALVWLRSKLAPRKQLESAGGSSQQESESATDGSQQASYGESSDGESVDESAV
ncbi:MAG: hypothetical protein F4110_04245 [Acidimicrobiaceae bacterium]|nr:hypothetical protein [Acidimicrobiaceae bacterium]MYE96300.1 hypothetical protein [Acidimicrobiaceae bacterium]MYI53183.1 hypothetical protein [Acidimicrobiaceae bacterium]